MKAVSVHLLVQVENSVDTKAFRDSMQQSIGLLAGVVSVDMRPNVAPYPILRNDGGRSILYVDPMALPSKAIHRPDFGLTPREIACHLGAAEILTTDLALSHIFQHQFYRRFGNSPDKAHQLGEQP